MLKANGLIGLLSLLLFSGCGGSASEEAADAIPTYPDPRSMSCEEALVEFETIHTDLTVELSDADPDTLDRYARRNAGTIERYLNRLENCITDEEIPEDEVVWMVNDIREAMQVRAEVDEAMAEEE